MNELVDAGMSPEALAILVGVAGTLVLLAVLIAAVQLIATLPTRRLRKMGYKLDRETGRWVKLVDRMRVTWVPNTGWIVRIGVYGTAELRLERRGTRRRGGFPAEAFATGFQDLDDKYVVLSERAPFAKELLAHTEIRKAFLAVGAARMSLRGDELVIDRSKPSAVIDKRVIRLAEAIARSIRPVKWQG
jgi:hypothetical protein